MILEKLTIIDTFKQWRDKINAIIDEYEGVPSTDKVTGTMTIDTDRTQAYDLVVDIPSSFNENVSFAENVTVEGELNAISSSTMKLQNPIQLNGILFDGSIDITTPNWGKMRDFIISDYAGINEGKLQQINGSENYTLRMPETFKGYLDGDAKFALNLKNMRNINGIDFNGGADVINFATCASDGGEQVKSVNIPNFKLVEGATVVVHIVNENTHDRPQLNVNNTGSKEIYFRGKQIDPTILSKNSINTFVYYDDKFNVVTGIDASVAQNVSALDVEYPLLSSPIRNGIDDITSSLFAPSVTLNPSKNSITANKFIANINNTSSTTFFTIKNFDEIYNTTPVSDKTIRYMSYEDNKNHMLSALAFQKNADGSVYSNIVVPKFNANGNEISQSVLQVGWNSSNKEQVNCNGSLLVRADLFVDGSIYGSVSNDYAEFFEKGEETEAGDIIALDENSPTERYVKATDKSKLVVGIHSDTYGHILGGEISIEESEKTHIPVGLSGRVFVKFKGKSILGEAVVPSETPGVGRLYDEFLDDKRKIVGYIVYDPEPTTKDVRKVRVLINR